MSDPAIEDGETFLFPNEKFHLHLMSQVYRNSRETYRALSAMTIISLLAPRPTQSAAPKKQRMAEKYNQAPPNEAGAEDGAARMNTSNDDHPSYSQMPGDQAMVDLSAQMNDVEMGNNQMRIGDEGYLMQYDDESEGDDGDPGDIYRDDSDSDSDYPSETDDNGDMREDDEGSDDEGSGNEDSGGDLSDEELIEINQSNTLEWQQLHHSNPVDNADWVYRILFTAEPNLHIAQEAFEIFLRWANTFGLWVEREMIHSMTAGVNEYQQVELTMEVLQRQFYEDGNCFEGARTLGDESLGKLIRRIHVFNAEEGTLETLEGDDDHDGYM
ncbi:hypothetical protein LTR91_002284 [Friedmanniomyces endolithicus]|uniref:Uncharacterized protein n=1 Tax=Friedmanniomyces endolithicus TaxID=329885 RepID=A0AAN6FLE7_9PEZI|nr:hypothetical protein LTR01_001221 [Friedmanniomyces endolithicus]KAK0318278.1 hypothetical protein LTR82_010666 [Friedmanniomyces endolithicus]KAK0827802.1 hypothetical protein LTR73_005404 [Friedmanniomyces endolithicus]KAK0930842.1 hypothetical protein LTR57_001225 [Friedmanniomyces endolithicus]KAK1011000.1 hypothetical protein LTR91_002284 [Friedmanniomyces endolithicus]